MKVARSTLGIGLACALSGAGCGLDVTGAGNVAPGVLGAADGGDGGTSDGGTSGPAASSSSSSSSSSGGGASDAGGGGGGDASTSGGDAAACDQDRDGYPSKACGGGDCCDDDARVHPGASDWQSGPGGCGGYDFNCDGNEEKRYGLASCHLGFGCEGSGFTQDTGCGVDAAHTTCWGVFMCHEWGDTQTQQCR